MSIQDIQNLLATTLAACDVFQEFVGAANSTEALERIYHDAFPKPNGDKYTLEELEAIRPCALIFTPDAQGYITEYDSSLAGWRARGIVYCVLYRTVPTSIQNEPGEVATTFRVIMSNLINELKDKADAISGGMLAARRMMANGPFRADETQVNELGDEQAYELIIEWGVGS